MPRASCRLAQEMAGWNMGKQGMVFLIAFGIPIGVARGAPAQFGDALVRLQKGF